MANTPKTLYTSKYRIVVHVLRKILLLKGMDGNHVISMDNMKEDCNTSKA